MKEKSAKTPGERSAACSHCGKTFARSDTLLRHEKSHHATEDRGPIHRVTHVTFRACQACALARSRCSGGQPCARCNVRKLECTYPNKRRRGMSSDENANTKVEDDGRRQQLLGHFSQLVFTESEQERGSPTDNSNVRKSSSTTDAPIDTIAQSSNSKVYDGSVYPRDFDSGQVPLPRNQPGLMQMDGILDGNTGHLMNQGNYGGAQMPSQYSETFMNTASNYDYVPFDEPLNWIPPSIYPSPYDAELEQDFAFILPTLSDTADLGHDFGMAIPLDSTTQIYQVPTNISPEMPDSHGFPTSVMGIAQSPASSASDGGILAGKSSISASNISDSKRKKRKASFAPDLFSAPRKERTSYAFPDTSGLSSTVSPGKGQDHCSQNTYDAILSVFRRLCVGDGSLTNAFQTPNFPNIVSLNTCLGLYFEHFHFNYPLIHRASFGLETHWLVLLAVAAIGSTFIKTEYALDTREAFQEFLRRAIHQYDDGAPDVSLDICLAQARILNLIGLVQADREQLRALAPRYHADLARWCLESGVLQLSESGDFPDPQLNLHVNDARAQSWKKWIRIESLRRIGYMSWMLDCSLGYIANARPLCNMDDARTPMPCSETPWDASTLDSWAEALEKAPKTPSLCEGLEILYNKKKVDPSYSDLSQTLLIHALYLRTWSVGTHIKQPLSEWIPTGKARGFLNTPTKDNFWLPLYPLYANWRNSACDCLDVLHWQASSVVAKASGVEHGVILHLHLARIVLLTPFQEIQDLLFSLIGKVGNSSKASFYVHDGSYQPRNSAKLPQIRKITWRWLREDQHKARLAMVHAGSVFWYVRRYSSTSFYEPIAVYLATLVLWTYGSYKSAALERDAAASNRRPEGGPSGPDAEAVVQPSRMERKEPPVKFISRAAAQAVELSSTTDRQRYTSPASRGGQHQSSDAIVGQGLGDVTTLSPQRASTSDSDESSSPSSSEQPDFIWIDRPCDDEMVQHFVRNGHNMSGHMSNVGDICKTPQKVLIEGAKLLRTRLACWGASREYYEILTKLAELRKAG